MRNVEIKARVDDWEGLFEKAKTLSSSPGTIIMQHDTFFQVQKGRLKLRKFEDNSAELIFYDRPDLEGPKLCDYDKCVLDSKTSDSLKSVLERALGAAGVVKKKRNLFMIGQTRLHIDEVENLGHFMELEVQLKPEQSIAEGEKIAEDLMMKLGIKKENLLCGAYTDLLKKK